MTAKNKGKEVQEHNAEEEKKHPSVDGGYAWVVLVASFLVSFILDGVMYSFGILLDEIKINFPHEPSSKANLLSSLNTGFLFCSGPIVSGLTNAFGCRAVVMGGGLVTAIVYMLTLYAPSLDIMMITYGFLGGISTGCTYIASLIIIAEYFDKKRGVATGITMAGSGVGSFAFPPLISLFINSSDWKFAFAICACIILQTCVCGAFLTPLSSLSSSKSKKKPMELKNMKQTEELSGENDDPNGNKFVQTYYGSVYSLTNQDEDLPCHQRNACLRITLTILKEMFDFKLLFQNLGFLLITISNFFLFTGYFAPFLYIVKIATNNRIEVQQASFILSIIGIVNIPMRMLFGFIADRRIITAVNLNSMSVVLVTASLFLFPAMQYKYWSLILFAIMFAMGAAGMNSLTTMYLTDLVGNKKFSNATGIVNLFRGFGCFLGPFLAGLVGDKFGDVNSFYFSGGCFILGSVFAVLVSFLKLIKQYCMKKSNEDNENELKAADDSELNKNLLKNKA